MVSTGQGFLGNNMFAYCINNPVRYADPSGNAVVEITVTVTATGVALVVIAFAGICVASYYLVMAVCEIGDMLAELACYAWAEITYYFEEDIGESEELAEGVSSYAMSPDPFDDDDWDDDYYDDDSNFGGKQRIGKQRGNAPRSNTAQNKQFRDATKGLTPEQRDQIHRAISHEGLGFEGICDEIEAISFLE